MSLVDDLEKLKNDTIKSIADVKNSMEVEKLRVSVLGKQGNLTAYLRNMSSVAKEERAIVGKAVNSARNIIESSLTKKIEEIKELELNELINESAIDITLPGRKQYIGTRHIINKITDEIAEVFFGLGYSVVEGPEIETDYYNFEALNAPKDHPSRSMQDTFYVKNYNSNNNETNINNILLRTQTSGVQVHTMEKGDLPIYIIAPGKVYRRDIADPSHLPQFSQLEGLAIDKNITFGDMKGTLEFFCKKVFGEERKTRFRAHYFPFTEPSAEVDVSCGICGGKGCRFCKGTGWSEILGCGMVDPNVLKNCNIDPEKYSGFAFGVGIERVACLKYNVPDLRVLLQGDIRFLKQF